MPSMPSQHTLWYHYINRYCCLVGVSIVQKVCVFNLLKPAIAKGHILKIGIIKVCLS